MNKIAILCLSLLLFTSVYAQDSIPIVDDFGEDSPIIDKTFPTIQIFNLPTTDVLPKGEMKLYIGHRMGELSTGIDGLFGLFTANSRIGADLGLLKHLTIGFGSTSQQKIYDGYVKYRIIQQGNHKMPITISIFSDISATFAEKTYPDGKDELWRKLSYFSSLMLSRKFSERYAAQASVAVIHKNMVASTDDKNTMYSVGIAMNYKLSRMWYLAGEFNYFPSDQIKSYQVSNKQISLGFQLHTGPRHVFQFFLSNSGGLNENTVITETMHHKKMALNHLRICFNIPTTFKLF